MSEIKITISNEEFIALSECNEELQRLTLVSNIAVKIKNEINNLYQKIEKEFNDIELSAGVLVAPKLRVIDVSLILEIQSVALGAVKLKNISNNQLITMTPEEIYVLHRQVERRYKYAYTKRDTNEDTITDEYYLDNTDFLAHNFMASDNFQRLDYTKTYFYKKLKIEVKNG